MSLLYRILWAILRRIRVQHYQLASHEQDIAKLRYADSLQDQVDFYDSRNRRTRGFIPKMVVDYIQQELLALYPIQEWTPHGLWEHLKMRYT